LIDLRRRKKRITSGLAAGMEVLPADDITLLPDDVSGLLDPSGLATFFTSEGELAGGLLPDFLIEFARDEEVFEEVISTVGSNGQIRRRSEWKEELTVRPRGGTVEEFIGCR
jgi:hypothetical protein